MVKEKALSASFAPGGQYCHTQQEDRGIEERKHNTVQDGGEVVSFWRHWVLVALLNLVTAIQLVTGGIYQGPAALMTHEHAPVAMLPFRQAESGELEAPGLKASSIASRV